MAPSSNQLGSIYIGNCNVTASNPAATDKKTWTNTLAVPVYIRGGYIWLGCGMLGKADVGVELGNTTNGDLYLLSNDDHYEDRGGLPMNTLPFNVAPDYFLVNPNDVITLQLSATGPYSSGPCYASAMAVLYYLK